jgi:predicted 2-oxoglutarate/Fe(II)-dependent dioxygenase YbiX|tara:strand:+ start:2404 stop:3000 length:597 start_codon:yes stop_codon:yes gene_type:complete
MNVLDFVGVYNTIPKETCNSLIKGFKKVKYTLHQWQDVDGKSLGSRKNKKEELKNYMMKEEEQNTLVPFITDAFYQYRHNTFSLYPHLHLHNTQRIINKMSRFRLNRYDKNTNMAPHVDNIHDIFYEADTHGNERGVPILSIIGLLNDNYKGGEFYVCNQKINLKQGDVLIFPSNFIYPHEVKTITKGTRYSFITWGY